MKESAKLKRKEIKRTGVGGQKGMTMDVIEEAKKESC